MARKKKGEGGSQAFAVAQQIGKSLFLPIAVLPPAGILLGIGSSFTNSTTIATYHLDGILHPGSILYMFFQMLNGAGNAVFGNLALIFALAVALGMAKKEKGVAVLSAAIFYLIMLTTMNVLLQIDGSILADGSIGQPQKNVQTPIPNPNLCFQNIKYFLESFKASSPKELLFSEKFVSSPLYSESTQIPESFYKLHRPFDRNSAFFIPHGNRRNGNYFRNKNWYPKYPMILSKNCELMKNNNKSQINTQDEGVKDLMMKDNMNRFYCLKYSYEGKDAEVGPYSASIVFAFLKNYYINKTQEEQKKMNLLIRDVFDDSYFSPDALYVSLQKECGDN